MFSFSPDEAQMTSMLKDKSAGIWEEGCWGSLVGSVSWLVEEVESG